MRKQLHPYALAVCLITVWMLCCASSPQRPASLLILPLQVPAGGDLDYISDGMAGLLPSRLSMPRTIRAIDASTIKRASAYVFSSQQRSLELARKLNFDFLLDGTITRVDAGIRVDARIIDVRRPDSGSTFTLQTKHLNSLIPEAESLAARIRSYIVESSGLQSPATARVFQPAPEPAAVPEPAPAQRPLPVARPARIQEQSLSEDDEPAAVMNIPPAHTPPLFERDPFMNHTFSTGGPHTLTTADLNGDGRRDFVLATGSAVMIYSLNGTRLALRHTIPFSGSDRIINVGSADLNGNGRDELYVTCQNEHTTFSFVLELSGTDFTRPTPPLQWLLRVYDDHFGELMLLGQKTSGTAPVPGEIYRLHWQEGSIRRGHRIKAPEEMNLYAFANVDLAGNGRASFLGFTPGPHSRSSRLTLYCPDGRLTWQDQGEPFFFPRSFIARQGSRSVSRTEGIPLPVICRDFEFNGIPEILIAKNTSMPARRSSAPVEPRSGTLMSLRWTGSDMIPVWTGPQFRDWISDYTLADMNNDGIQELYVLSIASSGIFGRTTATLSGFRRGV